MVCVCVACVLRCTIITIIRNNQNHNNRRSWMLKWMLMGLLVIGKDHSGMASVAAPSTSSQHGTTIGCPPTFVPCQRTLCPSRRGLCVQACDARGGWACRTHPSSILVSNQSKDISHKMGKQPTGSNKDTSLDIIGYQPYKLRKHSNANLDLLTVPLWFFRANLSGNSAMDKALVCSWVTDGVSDG